MDAFYQITDEGFPGAKSLDFIGQRIVYVEPFGRYWGWSDLVDGSSWNTLNQAQAETSPDRIQGLIVSHNEVLIFGERTIEPWAHAPTETAVFQLQVGSVIESGCAAGRTIQRLDNSVFYLTNNGQIARLNGYTPQVISTAAMEASIRGLNWSRAFAFTWEDAGHVVYYITFPDGHTWGYDVRQGKWHRRASYGLDRWRINALAKSNGKHIAGDYSSGRVYEVEWGNVYEACEIMPRMFRSGVLHNASNRVRVDGFRLVAATGQPPIMPNELENVALQEYRWLGTGQLVAGTRASIRPLSTAMVWVGSADSEVTPTNTTANKTIVNYGDKVFSLIDIGESRVADVDNITVWSDGPTGLSLGTMGLGHASVFGDRLWIACKNLGLSYLTDPDDAAFVTISNMLASFPSFQEAFAVTGNGDNVLCMNGYGAFVKSADAGVTWAAGANEFGSGNRFYTSYGAIDSNGDRVVAAGGETGLVAKYTDSNGTSFTSCTVPAVSGSVGNQVRYCGDERWLIACRGNAANNDGLFKSLDNGATFTAVTLPAALEFSFQSKQNIAVDPNTGRVVIAGAVIGTGVRKYYYSDDLTTWTEISTTGTDVGGIVEVYRDAVPEPDNCVAMEGGFFQLRYAKDGAENYSTWRGAEPPRTGWFLQPIIWRRIGMMRHGVYEVMDTSNRPQDIVAAEIIAASE